MADTRIKAGQFYGVIGHGTDGYFLMTNADGSMSWAEGGASGPSVTSVDYPGDDTAADPAGGQTVVLTGTGFAASGMTVSIGGTTAPSVAHDSNTQLTITTPAKAAGDYDIVVTNTVTGASGTFVNGISYNGIPTWTTAAGSLGTFESETTISTITLQATEPDGGTITFNITNGALPSGLSLTGANIDGTTTAESSTTLYSFTIEAIDDENQSTPRNFSITVNASELTPSENFTINTYTGTGSAQSIEGKIGTAAYFNGSSKIDITGFPNFGSTGVSISAWVNVDSFSNGPTIVNLYSNNSIVFGTNTSGNFFRSGQGTTVTSTSSMSTGTWHHVVMSAQSNGDVNLYLDGQPAGSGSCTTAMYNDNNVSDLIGAYGTLSQPMNGKIDQVRIFNKALSSSEVTTLYGENNASSTKSTTDIFDDGSGVALYDFKEGAKNVGAKKHYLHVGDAGGQNTSVRINSVDSEFTYARPTGYAEWGGSFDPNNTATDYIGSSSGFVFSESNKKWDKPTSSYYHSVWSTNSYSSGKYYVELEFLNDDLIFGLSTLETADTVHNGASFYDNTISYYSYSATKNIYSNTSVSGGAVLSTNNVIGFAVDFDNSTLKYYINNTLVETETLTGYDGTPTNVSFVGTSFQPDLVWFKCRTNTFDSGLFDSVRGGENFISSNYLYNGEQPASSTSNYGNIASFDSNGFTTAAGGNTSYPFGILGQLNEDYVAWCWKAGGTAVSNTDGSITSSVSANPDAGFSIVKWAGDSSTATIGHGLSSAPEIVIRKRLDNVSSWAFDTTVIDGSFDYLFLNTTAAKADHSSLAAPTSTVFSTGGINFNGSSMIAYCFHSVDGYQKIGSYTGTGSVGSPTITTGFQPRFVIIKNINIAQEWVMIDSVRGNNPAKTLYPNYGNAEATSGNNIDFNSNGFTIQESGGGVNYRSGDTFIYLAIA